MAEYLTVIEVLAIHDVVVDEFGGAAGVRDLGALEAAVYRPQTGYYQGPVEEASALMESLLQNHPFVDGNKRTAFAAADVHLRLNGLQYSGTVEDATHFMDRIFAEHQVRADLIAEWLDARVDQI